MLSENELVELLDQLKLGALHGVSSDSDPVGHWPVLISDGLCLSLQSAARNEFDRQPDRISVVEGISKGSPVSDVCANYCQVHHINTGVADRSIIIGYERECLDLFSVLQGESASGSGSDISIGQSNVADDFSLAVASSLDPAVQCNVVDHAVVFLPLEVDKAATMAGGWRIRVELSGQQGELFIGVLNAELKTPVALDDAKANNRRSEAEVLVRVKTLSRSADSSGLHVALTLPRQVRHHFPAQVKSVALTYQDDECARSWVDAASASHPDLSGLDLLVQQSLQLAADDLYLLLLEAIGVGAALRIRFDPKADDAKDIAISPGARFECLSVNMLSVKCAELLFTDGELYLIVNE